MTKYGSIYIIKNKVSGKVYVGQTTQKTTTRWNAHIRNSKKDSINKFIISKALSNKINDFEFIEFMSCFSKEDLNFFEKKLIEDFDSLYPNGYNQTTGGNEYEFTDNVRERMRKSKLGKNINNHIVKIKVINVKTDEISYFNSFRDACKTLNISRSSILRSCKYHIPYKGYLFSYANQSGSGETKESLHAQRLEGETVKSEYNPSTSPRFPEKYLKAKEEINSLVDKGFRSCTIAKKLNLDKTMILFFLRTVLGK